MQLLSGISKKLAQPALLAIASLGLTHQDVKANQETSNDPKSLSSHFTEDSNNLALAQFSKINQAGEPIKVAIIPLILRTTVIPQQIPRNLLLLKDDYQESLSLLASNNFNNSEMMRVYSLNALESPKMLRKNNVSVSLTPKELYRDLMLISKGEFDKVDQKQFQQKIIDFLTKLKIKFLPPVDVKEFT